MSFLLDKHIKNKLEFITNDSERDEKNSFRIKKTEYKKIKSFYLKTLWKVIDSSIGEYLKELEGNFLIAGGSVLSLLINSNLEGVKDFDIFFETEEDYNKAYAKMTSLVTITTDTEFGPLFSSAIYNGPNSSMFTMKNGMRIDLIRKKIGKPEEVLNSFDISVCKVGFKNNGEFISSETTLNHIFSGVFSLDINAENRKDAILQLKRYIKYINKGFTPVSDSYLGDLVAMISLDRSQKRNDSLSSLGEDSEYREIFKIARTNFGGKNLATSNVEMTESVSI